MSATANVRMSSILVLSDRLVRKHISMELAVELIEGAFAANALGYSRSFPVVGELFDQYDAKFAIKSGYIALPTGRDQSGAIGDDGPIEVLGLKAGGYWWKNAERCSLPHRHYVILLFELASGTPVALIAANAITSLRTAAAGGVAARHLARPESSVVAVIGAGDQARAQVHALRVVRPVEEVRIWARRPEAAHAYAAEWQNHGLRVTVMTDVAQAVESADIVVTTTPSKEPLVCRSWVREGTHVNAIGADTPGKQELDAHLLTCSKVVVDSRTQAVAMGELQHQVRAGLLAAETVYAELGEICAGQKPGRTSAEEITIFDSTGMSFQDLALAGHVYQMARNAGLGETVTL